MTLNLNILINFIPIKNDENKVPTAMNKCLISTKRNIRIRIKSNVQESVKRLIECVNDKIKTKFRSK